MASAVKTTKVVGKDAREGRGVKVSARNLESVLAWIKDTKTPSEIRQDPAKKNSQRISVHTPAGIRVAHIGDVIVKWGKGEYTVIKAEDFAKYITIGF